jgi:hypothetical protein
VISDEFLARLSQHLPKIILDHCSVINNREIMTVHSSSESGLIKTDTRKLIRGVRIATLATLDSDNGHPYASLIAVATAIDASPVFLISDLAVHTRNIRRDPRISMLFAADSDRGKDPLNAGRVSVMGTAAVTGSGEMRDRFLARHPEAALYADFTDFSFYAMAITHAHYVGGFGRIASVEAKDILVGDEIAERWQAGMGEAMRAVNGEHRDQLARLAGGDAEMIACDPDGFDISCRDTVSRIAFAERLAAPEDLADAVRQIEP